MKLVCADHPTLDAVARCVGCGKHLCGGCRCKVGVRNHCDSCAGPCSRPVPAARPVSLPRKPTRKPVAPPRRRSPSFAAFLSLVPGLGQLYAGRFIRGLAFFGIGLALFQASMPLALGAFLFVFNLWDAFACTQLRNRRTDRAAFDETKEAKRDRTDGALFTAAGLGALGYSFWQMGGFASASPEVALPFAGLAAALLVAQETRS